MLTYNKGTVSQIGFGDRKYSPTCGSLLDSLTLLSGEVCVGIIVASIPTLRPGYKVLKTRFQRYMTVGSNTNSTTLPKPEKPSIHGDTRIAIPMPALRQDRVENQVICAAATDEDCLLPIQNFDIIRSTRFDLESQRNSI